MTLEPKEVTCVKCGNKTTLEVQKDWCTKCGSRIFYDPKDQKRHQWNTYYVYGVIIFGLSLGTILFVKLLEIMT